MSEIFHLCKYVGYLVVKPICYLKAVKTSAGPWDNFCQHMLFIVCPACTSMYSIGSFVILKVDARKYRPSALCGRFLNCLMKRFQCEPSTKIKLPRFQPVTDIPLQHHKVRQAPLSINLYIFFSLLNVLIRFHIFRKEKLRTNLIKTIEVLYQNKNKLH